MAVRRPVSILIAALGGQGGGVLTEWLVGEPVFSLYPTPGDVDVVIASELLEAGRTIEMDYVSPGRTTLVASTHRLFSIAEKSVPGDGIYPSEGLEAAARKLSRRFVGFDALTAARQHQTEVNALLLGALSATGVLPMTAADFEAAIREGGVAVERNVRGLKAGQEMVAAGQAGSAAPPADPTTVDVELKGGESIAFGDVRFRTMGCRIAWGRRRD